MSGVFDAENPPDDEDEHRLDDELEGDALGEEAPDEPLAPATWAGRQGWSGLPDDAEDQEEGPEEELPAEDDEPPLGDEEPPAEDEDLPAGDEELAEDEPLAEDEELVADAEVETGLTEEFDSLEQEFADDLEAEIAGEEEGAAEPGPDLPDAEVLEAAEARVDEGPEPPDEFEFDPDEPEAADGGDEAPDEPEAADRGDEAQDPREAGAGATVEADTLAVADQEEAREAALQGLRDRTAEHARRRGITDPGKKPDAAPAAASGDAEPGGEQAEQPEEPDEAEAAAVAAAATPPGGAADDGEKPPRAGLWPRFMAATFLIIASVAAATAVSVLVYLTSIAKGLGGLPGIENQLDDVGDQKAQNFLILGSDVRPDQSSKGLSDTTMLLRVDPDNAITQLSIPRDLRVNIPGHGIDKFNAAYSYGGPKLTLEVVKQLTENRIPIHHVVNVDFNGFADAVDAIGCVHVDVDRHYFNDNATAASIAEQYAEIDIQAGYQRLCGYKALQYVRYRHEDNDIVRAARQQGFLREARQKVPPGKLLDERDKLIDIFTDYTSSDIDDSGTLVELFKLMIDARNAQIAQIEFPYDSLDAEGYVTAGDEPLQDAVSQFLGEGSGGGSGEAGPKPDEGGGEKKERKPPEKPKPEPESDSGQSPEQMAAAQMIDVTGAAQAQATAIIQEGGKDLKFPVLYPTRMLPSGNATISDDSRYFGIDAGNGKLYHGYKFVMTMQGTTYPTAYYGVSGTDWVDAPLFANPSERRKIGDREYLFYRDGGQLRMLAFERKGTMYWVTNTLDKLLSEPQMIAIAQNLREAGG